MNWQRVWYGTGPLDIIVRAILWPASILYGLGWRAYLAGYKLGLKKPFDPPCQVLCIGNLTVGGSGKTPMTIYIANLLRASGRKVVISCSGYGSGHEKAATLAPSGPLDAAAWGDEPAWIREQLGDVPLVVGRRRIAAATIVSEQFPGHLMVMDDGFQHLPLKKDVAIVLHSPKSRLSCLPAGPFREPLSSLARADLVLPNDHFEVIEAFGGLWSPNYKELHCGEVQILTAIENPDRLQRSLESNGFELVNSKHLPDHDPLTAENLFGDLDALPLIVTGKDWVKIRKRSDVPPNLFVALHSVRVEPEQEFLKWLNLKLGDGN